MADHLGLEGERRGVRRRDGPRRGFEDLVQVRGPHAALQGRDVGLLPSRFSCLEDAPRLLGEDPHEVPAPARAQARSRLIGVRSLIYGRGDTNIRQPGALERGQCARSRPPQQPRASGSHQRMGAAVAFGFRPPSCLPLCECRRVA